MRAKLITRDVKKRVLINTWYYGVNFDFALHMLYIFFSGNSEVEDNDFTKL
jgi:hypothetical protein